jgi:hypothetical protein
MILSANPIGAILTAIVVGKYLSNVIFINIPLNSQTDKQFYW